MCISRLLIGLPLLLLTAPRPLAAGDWPQWHGPMRDGVSPEASGFTDGRWPIEEAWRTGVDGVTNVGLGVSSPLIVSQPGAPALVLAMGWQAGRDTLHALSAETGATLWSESHPGPDYGRTAKINKEWYRGVLATPACDPVEGRLFTLSCDGLLACWDLRRPQNRLVWSLNVHDQCGPIPPAESEDYGFLASPLLLPDSVVIMTGAKDGSLVAFSRRDGRVLWRARNGDDRGWGSPALLHAGGRPVVAAVTRRHALLIGAGGDTPGEVLFAHPWFARYSGTIPSPVGVGDRVFFSIADGSGCKSVFVTVSPDGFRAGPESREIWSGPSTAASHRGHLYMAQGDAVQCVRAADGVRVWQSPPILKSANGSRGFDTASLVVCAGDDTLVIWSGQRKGTLRLAAATPEPAAYRELAVLADVLASADPQHMVGYTHVAVGAGLIVCKNLDGDLVAFRQTQPRARSTALSQRP